MHHDGLLDSHVRVGFSGWTSLVLGVQLVEFHFDSSTTRELGLAWLVPVNSSSRVVFTCDLIFVSLSKLSDHIPKKVLLFIVTGWQGWAEVDQVSLGLAQLNSDILDNSGQVMLNMSE